MLEKPCIKCNRFIRLMFEMPSAPGASVTRQELLFSWALSESFSPRWREDLHAKMSPALREKNEAGEMRNYSKEEQEQLIDLVFAQESRAGYLPDYVDPATEFRLIEVPMGMLEWLPILPSFSFKPYPVPLGHYINWDYKAEWQNDPRVVADRFLKDFPVTIYSGYPLIGYCQSIKSDVLFDGYARAISSLRRHRAGETIAPLTMIYCSVPQAKRKRAFYTEKY
jgi:hypothetical protein